MTEYSDGIQCFKEALILHLKAFRLNCVLGNSYADLSERLARNTTFTLLNATPKDSPWEGVDLIKTVSESAEVYLDPMEDAINDFAKYSINAVKRDDVASRTRLRMKALRELMSQKDRWLSSTTSENVLKVLLASDVLLTRVSKRS
jgi:hypothetical protein